MHLSFFLDKVCLRQKSMNNLINLQLSTLNLFFRNQGIFPQTKNSLQKKDQKGSLKVDILDPFNTKSYTKVFLAL